MTPSRGTQAVSRTLGTLDLQVRGRTFAPGDAVRGRLTLSLSEPMEARRLTIRLEATRRSVKQAASGGGLAVSYSKETTWMTEALLDGERVYRDGLSYPFELVVPDSALDEGASEWTVHALLDRAFGLKLRASVRVQLERRVKSARPKPRRRAKG